MGGDLLYLDSSALVKLVIVEAESAALVEMIAEWPARVTSELAHVEVLRAARRTRGGPAVERRAEQVMAAFHLLRVDGGILDQAARLEPRTLRSLDAIHLASAMSLGADLAALVVYDEALAAAGAARGLEVLARGARGE